MKRRLKRRLAGVLNARLPEIGLFELNDPRDTRGRRWKLPVLLTAVLAGIMAGSKCLAAVEALTDEMSGAMRKLLGIRGRVPDTTLRDALVRLQPSKLRRRLRKQIRKAYRRKALSPVDLPFGQMAIDGKCTKIDDTSRFHVQVPEGQDYGLLRTMTATLVSARPRPCAEMVPVPPNTNEIGYYPVVLRSLHREFGRTNLFDLVSGDAGICSLANATLTRKLGYHYLFSLKDNQPELYGEACRQLEALTPEQALAETEDVRGRQLVYRRVYLSCDLAGYLDWKHLKTVVRLDRVVVDRDTGEVVSEGRRYFVSSLESDYLEPLQWIAAVRSHWGVENNCHQTWDEIFEEDDRHWITANAQGTLVVMILRRIAYNMLTLFRSVTQRSEERRSTPWRDLIRWVYNTMIAATIKDITGLRPRKLAAKTA